MRKICSIILIFIVCVSLSLLAVTNYFFNVALKSKVPDNDEQESYAFLFKRDYLKQWIDSLNSASALRDTFIVSADGVKLHALYVRSPQKSANTALLIHGYTDNAIRMLMIGHLYNREMGYNILLPDLRGQGLSRSEYIQMGWKDRHDVIRWIDVAKGMYGDSTRIVIHGISMGAATTIMTSGEDLPSNVKCFVEDCGFTSVWSQFKYQLDKRYGLSDFPLLNLTSAYTDYRLGWNYKEASALEQIKKSSLPMFFIHGDRDDYVPTFMAYELYYAKNGEKDIWITEGVGHANSYWDYTDEYVKRTQNFVRKYIEN